MSYIERLMGQEDELQARTRWRSDELRSQGVVAIDPPRGRFLELVARLRAPKRVLEVGSGVGYSALWFMKGMGRSGLLETIEFNPEVAKELKITLKGAGLQRRVKVHVGSAIGTLRELRGAYDIVFIDAEKDEYPQYLDEAMRLTRRGSIILADNMLWSGATFLRGVRRQGTKGITAYTRRIFADPRLTSIIIPLGDGISFSYRIK